MKELKDLTKEELINYIRQLREQLNSEKFGLYFDRKAIPETVVQKCADNFPVLRRVKEKDIVKGNDKTNNHILIEGDNFHVLTALNEICPIQGMVDIIYIDPPYNTGNKDFIYNDKFVDLEDGFRHTKWLNFMESRLLLARKLLKESGLIIISIDDNEQAHLKILCDSIFSEGNFLVQIPRKTVSHIRTNSEYSFQNIHDYILVYAKDKKKFSLKKDIVSVKEYEYEDGIGKFTLKELQNSGEDGTRSARPNLYYPIYYNKEKKKFSLENDGESIEILPRKVRKQDGRWLWSREKFLVDNHLLEYKNRKLFRKSYYDSNMDQNVYHAPKSWFYEYSNSYGAKLLSKLLVGDKFKYSKPVSLMKRLLNFSKNKNAVVLDFFAGSGTTAHAILELNKEDGGNRQFILATNNENNIMDDVCYPRIKTVVTGLRKDNSKYSDGIPANVRYFKTDFIEKKESKDEMNYDLVQEVDSLLCLLEDTFELVESNNKYSIYENDKNVTIIYRSYYDLNEINKITEFVNKTNKNVTLYYYSLNDTPDDNLIDTTKNITIKPIPSKIFEIYKTIMYQIKEDYLL